MTNQLPAQNSRSRRSASTSQNLSSLDQSGAAGSSADHLSQPTPPLNPEVILRQGQARVCIEKAKAAKRERHLASSSAPNLRANNNPSLPRRDLQLAFQLDGYRFPAIIEEGGQSGSTAENPVVIPEALPPLPISRPASPLEGDAIRLSASPPLLTPIPSPFLRPTNKRDPTDKLLIRPAISSFGQQPVASTSHAGRAVSTALKSPPHLMQAVFGQTQPLSSFHRPGVPIFPSANKPVDVNMATQEDIAAINTCLAQIETLDERFSRIEVMLGRLTATTTTPQLLQSSSSATAGPSNTPQPDTKPPLDDRVNQRFERMESILLTMAETQARTVEQTAVQAANAPNRPAQERDETVRAALLRGNEIPSLDGTTRDVFAVVGWLGRLEVMFSAKNLTADSEKVKAAGIWRST